MAMTVIPVNSVANVKDYLIDVDDINRPVVLDMQDIRSGKMNSAISMITRLILMRKGIYADFPDLGIDIRGRYRFAFKEELVTLNQEIEEQARKYLPEFSPIKVSAYFDWKNNKQVVRIDIMIDKTTYQIVYNTEIQTIDGLLES